MFAMTSITSKEKSQLQRKNINISSTRLEPPMMNSISASELTSHVDAGGVKSGVVEGIKEVNESDEDAITNDEMSPSESEKGGEEEKKEAAGESPSQRILTAREKKLLRLITTGAGATLYTIPVNSITPITTPITWDPQEDKSTLLCSYNWDSASSSHTILVPGAPPKWTPPPPTPPFETVFPRTRTKDKGLIYVSYNYYRQPYNPFSPIFHALDVMSPNVTLNDIDVLLDCYSLRRLFEYAAGRTSSVPWGMDLYINGNTLLIVRKNARPCKHAYGVGYGHNFERAFTQPLPGMENAANHYRVFKYAMGPLNMMVRAQIDAYHDDGGDELTPSEADAAPMTTDTGKSTKQASFDVHSPIRVLHKGVVVPTSQLVEIKTRRDKHGSQSKDLCLDQLWFGRTTRLFTGLREAATGVLHHVQQEDATERLKTWQQDQEHNLQKLTGLLQWLQYTVKAQPGPVILAREETNGPLVMRELRSKRHIVEPEFHLKYWMRGEKIPRGNFNTNARADEGPTRGPANSGRGSSGQDRGNVRIGGFHVPKNRFLDVQNQIDSFAQRVSLRLLDSQSQIDSFLQTIRDQDSSGKNVDTLPTSNTDFKHQIDPGKKRLPACKIRSSPTTTKLVKKYMPAWAIRLRFPR
ncbi:hypothetical protein DM02DRAFT_98982 [Periconia macrospinosa]|uniref:Geranylgeranyl pyrophosphate synthetase n=1 Tax=Periconia macrospinosa TaxID=97972 RepID=A0A2V1E6R4_9PLEO|nr:hypothetical protein DM02DRAFT_98982 [Periconia macrospinosa]